MRRLKAFNKKSATRYPTDRKKFCIKERDKNVRVNEK
jgi:hypothetical protein